MTRALTCIALAITALSACDDPEADAELRFAAGVNVPDPAEECLFAQDELDDEMDPIDCAQVDPPAVADCGFCAVDWKTLRFPGSVSISPVVAPPFDPDMFPTLYPPADKIPKLFEYDTKAKCEALDRDTLFVRGKFWFTSDELPDKKRLLVVKPELLYVPKGIVWKEEACPAGVETVDYALKDYIETSDLQDLQPACVDGIVCPNSAGIYKDASVDRGWSCVSDSTWGTNLLNKRIAVMCYPRTVDGYGPGTGITAKVFHVRDSTPAPPYDDAIIVPAPAAN